MSYVSKNQLHFSCQYSHFTRGFDPLQSSTLSLVIRFSTINGGLSAISSITSDLPSADVINTETFTSFTPCFLIRLINERWFYVFNVPVELSVHNLVIISNVRAPCRKRADSRFRMAVCGVMLPTLPGFVVRIADHCIGSINIVQREARILGALPKTVILVILWMY